MFYMQVRKAGFFSENKIKGVLQNRRISPFPKKSIKSWRKVLNGNMVETFFKRRNIAKRAY